MRSLALAVTALFSGTLMSGCGTESGATADETFGLAAAATDHNVADHLESVEAVTIEIVNPCNGELIVLTGEARSQQTIVGPREALDAGFWLHMEHQEHLRAAGTGAETGATYTLNDIFHESFNSPNEAAPHATSSEQATGHVTSSLSGLSFDVRFGFHVVVPSGKEFKVTRLVLSEVCKG